MHLSIHTCEQGWPYENVKQFLHLTFLMEVVRYRFLVLGGCRVIDALSQGGINMMANCISDKVW